MLLYANRTQSDIVFRQELSEIEKGEFPALKTVHVLSRAGEDWSGEKGYIDKEKIEKYCGRRPGTRASTCAVRRGCSAPCWKL
jgi:NAD(P)H-flavin reductase